MLLGLVTPDSGRVSISGRRYTDHPRPGDEVGAALEATGFHPARSGRDHLRVYCTVNRYPHARADEVLQQVGLAEAARRAAGGYSLGMRQRLALATALLGDPRILILDEPANGLDPEGIAWLRRFLKQLAADGRTVLVSSHLLAEAQQLVDHVIILDRGRLVRQGPLADLGRPLATTTVRSPRAAALATALETELNGSGPAAARVEHTGPGELTVIGIPPEEVGRLAHRRGIELHELTSTGGDLERIFLALTATSQEQT
ncbi:MULTISPECIES: ATP-binding cassette domain-containing protein [unclassified Spirillospora]|uniref:ATP-binding cassette domain-containing protein n=1 Tax=unclassified Spirillospora TaxID=2642701 RepID=UPI003723D1B5